MPFVEISLGKGSFNEEQIKKLGKAIHHCILNFYQNEIGSEPQIWVLLREDNPNNWIINGQTLTEIWNKK